MLRKIGTLRELYADPPQVPKSVFNELIRDLAVLDAEYGETRDYLETGGYAVIVDTKEDVLQLQSIVNYEKHPCEWATRIGKDSGFLSALYLMNNEFAIMVFMPIDIAPDMILKDLED